MGSERMKENENVTRRTWGRRSIVVFGTANGHALRCRTIAVKVLPALSGLSEPWKSRIMSRDSDRSLNISSAIPNSASYSVMNKSMFSPRTIRE